MNIDIVYSKSSLNFLDKNSNKLSRNKSDTLLLQAIKKIYKLEIVSIDIKMLEGLDNTYRIRKGDIRIIFTIDQCSNVTVLSVNEIDFRGNIY